MVLPLLVTAAQGCAGEVSSEYKECTDVLENTPRESYISAPCLEAAEQGYPDIQYSVGMSFGYSGDHKSEGKYYRKAAAQNYAPAFLGLGHVLRSGENSDIEAAMGWYQRCAETKEEGYGYAALLLSELYMEQGNSELSQQWLAVCHASPYEGCSE